MVNQDYDEFIAAKSRKPMQHGFEPALGFTPALFDWQKMVVKWAIKQGRRFIGSELKESYWKQACKFLERAEEEGRSLFDIA